MATARRTKVITSNPMEFLTQVPNPEAAIVDEEDEDAIGEGLDEKELASLIAGFKPSSLFPIVVLAAACGARRNELLALRWTDLDVAGKKLRIERALEQTKKYGIRVKPPKTKRGFRTIDLDELTVNMLVAEHAKHQRVMSGIPDAAGDAVVSLVKLPAKALIFPAMPSGDEEFDLTRCRNPRNFSKEFARRAGVIGFGATRFHDLRGVHATALLDAGWPVNRVADRIGDDPAVLLRNYAKRKRAKQTDEALTSTLSTFATGFLGS